MIMLFTNSGSTLGVRMLDVRLSSYGCTREVGSAREKRPSGTK